MLKNFKRMFAALIASTLAAAMSVYMPVTAADGDEKVKVEIGSTVEAEDLTLNGTSVWTSIYDVQTPGYSGEGFVYMNSGSLDFEVDVPEEGMYELEVRAIQRLEEGKTRQQSVVINGETHFVVFPYLTEWTDINFGRYRLKKGTNVISFTTQYGYAAYDTVTIKKAEFPDLSAATSEPCDKNATAEVKGLMRYLHDMYGNHMLSGQQEIYGNGHTVDQPAGYSGAELLGYESEFEWIKKNFGVYPAIRGFDLMNTNPLYGWDDGTTERMIEWGKKGGIPTVCWHINLPTDFAKYEVGKEVGWEECSYKPDDIKGFDVANATIEGTKEYEYVQLATKLLAEQLLKVQEENIPVIFRPYHEAQGNYDVYQPGTGAWFWWGQDGPEPYKALWKQLYTDLTEVYGLHNLIWEYNSYDYETSAQWYPGDEYVDIVGYDKYNVKNNRHDGKTSGPNEDAISNTFYKLVDICNNNKMVSMPENDTVPNLNNMNIEKANWLYFCIWYDNGSENFLSSSDYNDPNTLKEIYQSDYCITLDELPGDWANYKSQENPNPTDPTDPTESTDPTNPTNPDTDFMPGDVTGDKKINVFDSISLKRYVFDTATLDIAFLAKASASDVTGDGYIEIADLVLLNQFLTGKDVTFKVYVEPVPQPQ